MRLRSGAALAAWLALCGGAAVAGAFGAEGAAPRVTPAAAETTPLNHPPGPGAGGRQANRLAREKSPYLLQHAWNPVAWHPWGEEAFRAAKERDVPIFLSIGYSTCHWCHVMERESFEDEVIAAYLNANFVAIKVDREERPDVDAIYMSMVQAMTGSGGWPLSVFLTPERKPFYGGTYFPPDDRFGRPGFLTLLRRIRDAWTEHRDRIEASGSQIVAALNRGPAGPQGAGPGPEMLAKGYALFKRAYDAANGGFSPAPKFPRAHEISFLLREQRRSGDAEGLAMIRRTLDAMAAGGIYDHLGGGFHRYATDPKWLVPHFEKMLYDQAILARAYLEAWQATSEPEYARVARETVAYVLRDLKDSGGAFHSAEDADSEGEEGKFYVWRPAEIEAVLGAGPARAFGARYGVTAGGNFEDGASILHLRETLGETAKRLGIPPDELARILADGRTRLLAARGKRIRPHLDDKVLTDWNGLMISALAFGGAVLDERAWTEAATAAAEFVLGSLRRDGRLLHRWRDGEAAIPGFLDDYAFFGTGLLDLYEATFDARWLAESQRLAREAVRLFRDEADGAFTLAGRDAERLIVPTKEIYDGALPSGNSVAASWLLRLGRITMDREMQARGEAILRAFAADVDRHPPAYPYYLMGLGFAVGPTREIVIAGDPAAPETKAMVRAVRARFLPDAVLMLNDPGPGGDALRALAPFVKEQKALDGRATAYVCRNWACERPTNELRRLEELLDAGGAGAPGAPAAR